MTLKPVTILSPNFDDREIKVEFLVLHYTACDLSATLDILKDPNRKASAHVVIDLDGRIYELVNCWDGKAKRAWHAGVSEYNYNGTKYNSFNDISLCIELVNFNGNCFDYTDAQYNSIKLTLDRLKNLYPALNDPHRILGHEHVAGFRGKSDPGLCFDWRKFYKSCYGETQDVPVRDAVLDPEIQKPLNVLKSFAPSEASARNQYFQNLSLILEKAKLIK